MPLNEKIFDHLKKKSEKRWDEHREWEPIWQEVTELVRPSRSEITSMRSRGRTRTKRLYDTTAVESAERLAAALGSTVTSPIVPWIEYFVPVPLGAQMSTMAGEWFQHAQDMTLDALRQNNFYRAIGECYGDYTSVNTMAMFVDERLHPVNGRFDGINFKTLHLNEYAIGENGQETVDAVDIRATKTLEEWAREVGKDNLPPDDIRALDENQGLKMKEYTQWIFQRYNQQISPIADRFPIVDLLVCPKTKHVIREGGFHEWPAPVGRYHKADRKETYARGPAFTALPDIQSLNKADEYGLKAWAQAIRPPAIAMHQGVVGPLDLRSDKITYVNQKDAIQYLVSGERLDVSTMRREDKRDAIRRIFFMDQIQFIPERGKTPATAAEINARLQIMLQIMGPTLVSLEFDFLVPLVDRVYSILRRHGMIQDPPDEVIAYAQEANNANLGISFIGPISRARKQADVQALDDMTNYAMLVSQTYPEIKDNYDADEAFRLRSQWTGMPQKVMRPRKMVQALRDERVKQQQQAQEDQRTMMAAQVAKDGAQAGAAQQGVA